MEVEKVYGDEKINWLVRPRVLKSSRALACANIHTNLNREKGRAKTPLDLDELGASHGKLMFQVRESEKLLE